MKGILIKGIPFQNIEEVYFLTLSFKHEFELIPFGTLHIFTMFLIFSINQALLS